MSRLSFSNLIISFITVLIPHGGGQLSVTFPILLILKVSLDILLTELPWKASLHYSTLSIFKRNVWDLRYRILVATAHLLSTELHIY